MHTRKLRQSATVFEMDDPPYTAPEEDPFSVGPLLLQPRRRRSSMLDKWIQDQQVLPTDFVDVEEGPSVLVSGTRSHPYLAYPELGTVAFHASEVSVNSYDLLEDDDIPENETATTPITPTTTTPSRLSSLLQSPSSFRGFHIPFRSGSPAGSLGTSSATGPRTPTRGLFFNRTSRSSSGSTQHRKSSSLSTLNALGASGENNSLPVASATRSKWRPSVLGHFGMSTSQPSVVDTLHTRSRPSISSNHTYTTATQTESDVPITPPRSSASESSRARSQSYGSMLKLADNTSSFSVWSGPSYLGELQEFGRSPRSATSTISCDGYIGMPPRSPLVSNRAASTMSGDGCVGMPSRVPLGPKPGKQDNRPEVAYSSENKSRTLPRVSFAALGPRKKKKRLVISGIAAADTRKFEAAKRWCESFGPVSQITRMPNDDLHVHFRNAEVADTVCRLRAKVCIRGVGSVQLSWYVGNGTENSR
ncbi:hypothetical protein GGX14DRAFT_478836 [Mycena pura]|uniref:RRM domain-containing protein n=1 Tax=Mycena pura TaxID=153505 RepID=A0AAD6UVB9_9AGAR|nr:hypothetical protein GGX14DRAFT_478836 [Mycena pura]